MHLKLNEVLRSIKRGVLFMKASALSISEPHDSFDSEFNQLDK